MAEDVKKQVRLTKKEIEVLIGVLEQVNAKISDARIILSISDKLRMIHQQS